MLLDSDRAGRREIRIEPGKAGLPEARLTAGVGRFAPFRAAIPEGAK